MRTLNGQTRWVGVVGGVDKDGLVYVRLRTDSSTMIAAEVGDFVRGEWIELQVPWAAITVHVIGG